MAIACFLLVTFPPLPPLPDFSVPRFFLRIALSTDLLAALPYFRPLDFSRERFSGAIVFSPDRLVEQKGRKGCHIHLCCNVARQLASNLVWSK
jgi:hypothetical protein